MTPCYLFIVFLYFLVFAWKGMGKITPDSQHVFDKDFTLPLRGLCALLVVTGHLENFLGKGTLGNIPLLHFLHWSTPAVSVFFFLSGYGLYKKQLRVPITSFKWILPSIAKIAVALSVVCAIYLAMYYSLDKDGCLHLLRNGSGSGRIEFLPHSWYMYALMVFYLSFCFCYRYFKKSAFGALCLSLALYSVFVWHDKTLQLNPALWTKGIWAFPVGVFTSCHEETIKKCIRMHFNAVFTIIPCFLLLCTASAFIGGRLLRQVFFSFMSLNLTGLFTYVLFQYLKFPAHAERILSHFGDISMEIYLVQGIFQRGLLYFAGNKYAYVALNYLFIMLFAAAMHWVFVKTGLFGPTKSKASPRSKVPGPEMEAGENRIV